MRYRVLAVVAAAVALSVVAATTAQSGKAAGHTLTVWLQVDAQNGWPQVVAATNNAFENSHPGWNVNVQYQGWGDHLQKFDATIAANNTPDVIEMGNTEMTKYMAAGAFANITADKGQFDNSSHWLAGLKKSSMFNGKLYGVPYYAGSRLVTYRSDLFAKVGVKKAPKSLKQFESDLAKVKAKNHAKGFTPFYMAGTDWYSALSFLYDYGGSIAKFSNRQVAWDARLEEVGRRAHRLQEVLPRDVAEVGFEAERGEPGSVHRLLAEPEPGDLRAWLVQLLHRQEVHEGHQPVRDAEPQGRPVDAGLPRWLRPRRSGAEQLAGAGTCLDGRLHEHGEREGPPGGREHPERHEPAQQHGQRRSRRPRRAGSSRRRSTRSTSRTATSCARCSGRS